MTGHLAFYACIILGAAGACLILVDAKWSHAIGGLLIGLSIALAHAVGRYL